MIRFSLRRFLLVSILISLVLGFWIVRPHLAVIGLFSGNRDVIYNPDTQALELVGATKLLLAFGKSSRPVFMRQLDHPNQFASAHIALAISTSSERWVAHLDGEPTNYLGMTFSASPPNLLFDFESQPPLKQWWCEYLPRVTHREDQIVSSGVLMFPDFYYFLDDFVDQENSKPESK